jgi:dienelactone hydrolase
MTSTLIPREQQLIAIKPITVGTTGRPFDLQVKVTAPAIGNGLPVIVFSHGNAWSMDGYQPLVDVWAAAGFVVIQPTHLDSRRNGIGLDDPRFATIWRVRIDDVHAILDNLHDIVAAAALDERIDRERIAVVGHSYGAHTASTLLGARVLDAHGTPGDDVTHPAVRAGALIGVTGTGDTLTPFAAEHLPFMRPDYSSMTTPALVVAGGHDQSTLSTRGPDWFTDAFHLSPAPKSLLTITRAEHTFGGIAGEAVAETTDEDPATVDLVGHAVAAYLLHELDLDHAHWTTLIERAALRDDTYSIRSK